MDTAQGTFSHAPRAMEALRCVLSQMHDDDSDETAILKLAGKKLDQDECERLT